MYLNQTKVCILSYQFGFRTSFHLDFSFNINTFLKIIVQDLCQIDLLQHYGSCLTCNHTLFNHSGTLYMFYNICSYMLL